MRQVCDFPGDVLTVCFVRGGYVHWQTTNASGGGIGNGVFASMGRNRICPSNPLTGNISSCTPCETRRGKDARAYSVLSDDPYMGRGQCERFLGQRVKVGTVE